MRDIDREIERQRDREIDRQRDRQIERQTDREIERQTDRKIESFFIDALRKYARTSDSPSIVEQAKQNDVWICGILCVQE